jgi:striatin 1/3/4
MFQAPFKSRLHTDICISEAALPNDARPLSIGSLPNGGPPATKPAQQAPKDSVSWPAGTNATNLSLGKPPPGRDPRSRARSRDYLKQCLLEVSYLTSPQAMNPIPNHALLGNPNNVGSSGGQLQGSNGQGQQLHGGLALPNLPNFGGDSGLNGRPKKGISDINNKDFPLVNGNPQSSSERHSMFTGPIPGSTSVSNSLIPTSESRSGDSIAPNTHNRDGNQSEEEPTQLTAIFRPDEGGAWREKLKQANEEAMRQGSGGANNEGGYLARMSGNVSSLGMPRMGASGWDIQSGGDDTSGILGAHAEEEEDEEGSSLMGDDSGKKWKVRKTLRK